MSGNGGFRGFGVPPAGYQPPADRAEFRSDAAKAQPDSGRFIRRDEVANGQIYARDGVRYFAHGNGERFLAVTAGGDARFVSGIDPQQTVEVVGAWDIITSPNDGEGRVVTRQEVRFGELYRTESGEKLYANLGRMYDGVYAAINMDHIYDDDFVESKSPDKRVVVVGTFRFVPKD